MLVLLAVVTVRLAHQTRVLRERGSSLMTMLAWSRTIEFQGEWISFEEYLERRFNLETSHGMSPAAARKALAGHRPKDRQRPQL